MAAGEVLKTTFFTQLAEQAGLFTIDWVQTSSNPTRVVNESDLALIVADIVSSFPVLIRSCLAQEASYLGCKTRTWRLVPSFDIELTDLTGAGVGGAANEGYLPRQLSGLLRKRTAVPTRQGRGRAYVPFPPKDAITDLGLVAASYKLNLDQLATEMEFARVATIDGQPSTWMPCVSGISRPGIGITITSVTAAGSFATQRRRGDFGSPNAPLI